MNHERGSITMWMLGLVFVVFLIGGIGVDLWRGLAAHRRVTAVVDAAAVAAGSAIDEQAWRASGQMRLDVEAVDAAVAGVLVAQGVDDVEVVVDVAADGSMATVSGSTAFELTLLRIVSVEPLRAEATATGAPALAP